MPLSKTDRLSLTNSYRGKLEPILLDPATKEMFCTEPASVDFQEVVDRRLTVLLDFRGETNQRDRLLKTRWAFDCLLAFIRNRGPGQHRPLAVHFDEITELTNQTSAEHDLFSADLDYLFNVLQRNYSCWITAAHQQMWQLSEKTQETLMSLGTQIIGTISDMVTAESLARRYAPLDPDSGKRWENVWGSESFSVGGGPDGHADHHTSNIVLEQRPVDFPMHEQAFVAARAFKRLRPFEFLAKPRDRTALTRVSFADWVGNPWPSQYQRELAHVRRQLAMRLGEPACEPDGRDAKSGSVRMDSIDDYVNAESEDQRDFSYWNTRP